MLRDRCNGNDGDGCNCCIKVEDSLVLIICGDVDGERLPERLRAFADVKDGNDMSDACSD